MTDFESFDGCTIYHGEPDEEIFLKWAHDEDLYLYDSYDEDLFLWDTKFVKYLMMVAAEDRSPKKYYALSVLANFSRTKVLFADLDTSKKIWAEIQSSSYRKNSQILDWERYFEIIYNRLSCPKPLSEVEMSSLVQQLFDYGPKENCKLSRTGMKIDGFYEYLRIYREWNKCYLYINPRLGLWEATRHKPLTKLNIRRSNA